MGNVVVMNYGFSTSLGEREIKGMGVHSKERKRGGGHYNYTFLCCCHLDIIWLSTLLRDNIKREG